MAERTVGQGSKAGIKRALATMLTVLELLDEKWDEIDDHSRRATIRLTIEAARDHQRRIESEPGALD